MTRRGWVAFGTFLALDALDFALTVRATLDFRHVPGAVTVMPLSQLLGWITSCAIFLALAGVSVGAVRARRARARYGHDVHLGKHPRP
jgi:hypothetical protein